MTFSLPAFEAALETTAQRHLVRCPPNLRESILYSLLSPGKRIRPRIAHATSIMLGVPGVAALKVGTALEMIHCFSLIHDDLPCMDNDDFRRGQPSNHKAYGEALALLAGDSLCFMGALALLDLRGVVSAERLADAVTRLHTLVGPEGTVGGQAAEMLLNTSSTEEDLRSMHLQKTGALFLASVLIPADLAAVAEDSPSWKALERFGQSLGSAFQTADDLEDGRQDKERPEVNILAHLTAEQAEQRATEELQAAAQQLRSIWGDASFPLITLTDEVLMMLKRASLEYDSGAV